LCFDPVVWFVPRGGFAAILVYQLVYNREQAVCHSAHGLQDAMDRRLLLRRDRRSREFDAPNLCMGRRVAAK